MSVEFTYEEASILTDLVAQAYIECSDVKTTKTLAELLKKVLIMKGDLNE